MATEFLICGHCNMVGFTSLRLQNDFILRHSFTNIVWKANLKRMHSITLVKKIPGKTSLEIQIEIRQKPHSN